MTKFYLVREKVVGYKEYITEANSEEEALNQVRLGDHMYPVDTDYDIESSEFSLNRDFPVDDYEDEDYNILRACKFLLDDNKEPMVELSPRPKPRKKKKTNKKTEEEKPKEETKKEKEKESKFDWAVPNE